MTRNSRAQDAFQQIMEFGSSHVLLVRSGGPTASLNNVASGPPHEVSAAQVRTLSAVAVKAEAPRVRNEISKVGTTLTYKEAVLNIKNVYNITEDVVDWYGLGTQLEISDSRLKKIQRENDTEDRRRHEMIVTWLFGDPEASWEKLSKALERVNHRVLADKIDREILPLQHNKPLAGQPYRGSRAVFHSLVKKGPPPPNSSFRSFSMEPVAKVYPDHDECSPDHVDYSPPPLPKRKPKCEDRDTNILMIKFGALSKPCKVHTGDPVICSNDQCTAILNCHSKITKEEEGEGNVWVCEFCSTQNNIEIEIGEIPKEGDILYLQQTQHSPKDNTLVSGITKDSIVVFCMDTSGSMGVTTEVPGFKELKGHEKLQKLKEIYAGSGIQHIPGQSRNVTYISRLQCVQAAIDHQLTTLARNNPSQRVAIVMFGDEVTVTGDGKPENEFVFVGEKLWKENAILKLSADIPTPSPIKQTKERLSEKLFSIEEEGQTALGGALLVSVDITKRAPGSKVILCTDGLANRGIGNLDDHKCTESSAAFYKKLGMTAMESSVSVSVLTIKGTECDLLHLGQVANLSGGNVDVVDPMSLTDEFVNILSTSVVAVQVNAKIILHSTLCFKDGDAKSTLSVPVGNVVDTTNLMYEFSNSEKGEPDKEVQKVPFQVQVKYTSLDGQQCLRVFTEVRPVTSDKRVANEGSANSVLKAHALQKSGNQVLMHTNAHGNEYAADIISMNCENSGLLSCDSQVSLPYLSISNSCFCSDKSDHDDSEYIHQPKRRKTSEGEEVDVLSHEDCTLSALAQPRCQQYPACSFQPHLSPILPAQQGATNADELAANAFKRVQGKYKIDREANASQHKLKVQKHIILSNEGYGFGFLVSPGKGGGTVVQSLIPNGVAWKDCKLQKDDKLLTINGECVENMAHQDVVRKLKLLNEEATNSIILCVEREEVSEESPSTMQEPKQYQKLPRSKLKTGCDEQANDLAMDTQHGELISVTLQSEGPDSLGLVFKFDDSEQLIIEEILPDRTADKDCCLKVNDTVLEINGEAVTGKTNNAISVMMKDIEESNGSIELLVRRENQTGSRARHEKTKLSHRKPHTLRKRLSSWYQSLRSSRVPMQEPSRDESGNYLKISLHNEGYGFGFTVQETEDKSIVVSSVFPEGVAYKDDRLMANDKLIEINGRKVSDMTYKEVIVMLRQLNEDDHSIIDLTVV